MEGKKRETLFLLLMNMRKSLNGEWRIILRMSNNEDDGKNNNLIMNKVHHVIRTSIDYSFLQPVSVGTSIFFVQIVKNKALKQFININY